MAQALLARAGFDPHRVLDMNEHEIESHLSSIRKIANPKGGDSNTRRFKGHRKNKPK